MRRVAGPRAALLLPGGLALLAGLYAALMLVGVPVPSFDRLPDVHGILLVLGFVGTLIALERAIALARPLAFTAPGLLGLGALLLLIPVPAWVAGGALLAGTAALVAVYQRLWLRQRDDAVLVQAMGAVLAVGAAGLWLGGVDVPVLLPWLVGFVILTIAGERLELARLAMGPGAGSALVALAAALMAAVTAALLWPATTPLLGLAVVVLVGWLAHHDVARRTIRGAGLARYMAAAMLAGYAWLVVAGLVWLVQGSVAAGAAYDAVVHAVFLGFTLSMIMAHAPVILPAVLRRPLPHHALLWVPFTLLHASLVVRLWLGGALLLPGAWQAGGIGNVVAVLLFVGVVAWRVAGARRPERSTR